MLTFAVVTSRTGGPLSAGIRQRLVEVSESGTIDSELATPVAERVLWVNDRATTAVVAWWSGHDAFESGVLWHETPDSFTAMAGHGWPRGEGWHWSRPWAPQLSALAADGAIDQHLDRLSGVFAACHIDQSGGTIFTDPFGFGLVHTGSTDDYEVYASRSAVAAALLCPPGQTPARDPLGAGWMAYSQMMISDTTSFVGVDILPRCSFVSLGPLGASTRRTIAQPSRWFPEGLEPDDALDMIRDDLTSELTAISTMRGLPLVCDLTGGKDSRLILAMAVEAGITDRFEFFTSGPVDLPDVLVAKELRARFGLRQHPQRRRDERPSTWNPNPPTTLRESYAQYSFATSGMQNLWFNRRLYPPLDRISLTGNGGEVFYTNYEGSSALRRAAQLHSFLRGSQKFGAAGFCTPEAADHYERETDTLVEALWDGCQYVQDAVDRYYVGVRLRRWMGTGQEVDRNNRLFPLLGARSTAAAFGVQQDLRHAEYIPFQLMSRADRSLVTTPFAESTWPARLMEHVDDRDIPAAAIGKPRRIKPSIRGGTPGPRPTDNTTHRSPTSGYNVPKLNAATYHRDRRTTELLALVGDIAVDDPQNPLFTIVDHDAFSRLAADYGQLPHQYRQLVIGALTAAMWLGHHDQNPYVS